MYKRMGMVALNRLAILLGLDIRTVYFMEVSAHPRCEWMAGADHMLLFGWVSIAPSPRVNSLTWW